MGAVREYGTPVEIQAYHPRRGWEAIAETTAEMPYHDHNGVWFVWDVERAVPRDFWTWTGSCAEVRLRAVNAVDRQPLYAFDKSFPWYQSFTPTEPAWRSMSEVDMWFTWGHGNEVTVYSHDYLPLLERDRGF